MGSMIHEAQAIVSALRGQTLHVPDLGGIFKNWSVKTNPHYQKVIPVVEDAFDRMVKNPALRKKYREANYARFVSLYFPHPEWNQIKTLAHYIVWLFCWDDAIDQEGSDLSHNLLRAKTHRSNTIRVLENVLGLTTQPASEIDRDHVNAELKNIGDELQKAYTLAQRKAFMSQMRRYIEDCDKEQSLRLRGSLPDLETYGEIRHGTAGVWTLCALIEFGLGEAVPWRICHMEELHSLWAETSRGIWITNDILSLKKEMPKDDRAAESIVNAVPILMAEQGKSPQEAVDALLADLVVSVAAFEAAAAALAEAAGEEGRQAVLRYCDACRCMVTGSIQFTFESTRYKLAGCLNEDGSLDIPL
ncbi:hypothetical protein CkaCkLH20_05854 [Colletotrichum karsti]|uniref:Terpene synthase n=1 Tax=Colletotrichum karsti TaxID=1095194 RepID=A0A9P6I7D1_9PEZI|nr:uncharacterized protein CkaCkLH20_05854 [Colletotrichum karsti]KAF9876446.1 hypothetical protein CkaCkLH20_05854 [Colletotrichum karsti]